MVGETMTVLECPVCGGSRFEKVLDLGLTPLANNLMNDSSLSKIAVRYPLALVFCKYCNYVRIEQTVPNELMFGRYSYLSGVSKSTVEHFQELDLDMMNKANKKVSQLKIIDIGSNDGTLLSFLKTIGCSVLGVEPAENVAILANQRGIRTMNSFFDSNAVNAILSDFGKADFVSMTNVLTHVEHPNEMLSLAKSVLEDDGSIVVEFYYLPRLIKNLAFDQIYHEHISYFTLKNFSKIASSVGLDVYDAKIVDSQGGSLRTWLCLHGRKLVNQQVGQILSLENSHPMCEATFASFASSIHSLRARIIDFVQDLQRQGKRIVGYGAPAKSTILMNYCGFNSQAVEYVTDANPLKQGKFIPGTDIEIMSPDRINETQPEVIIIMAWNLSKEIHSYLKTRLSYQPEYFTLIPTIIQLD